MIKETVLYYILLYSGFNITEANTLLCIAKKESSLIIKAKNINKNGTTDKGLFQINTVWYKNPTCNLDRLDNPIDNVRCARVVYKNQGYKAWYAYTKYKNECDTYKAKESK